MIQVDEHRGTVADVAVECAQEQAAFAATGLLSRAEIAVMVSQVRPLLTSPRFLTGQGDRHPWSARARGVGAAQPGTNLEVVLHGGLFPDRDVTGVRPSIELRNTFRDQRGAGAGASTGLRMPLSREGSANLDDSGINVGASSGARTSRSRGHGVENRHENPEHAQGPGGTIGVVGRLVVKVQLVRTGSWSASRS